MIFLKSFIDLIFIHFISVLINVSFKKYINENSLATTLYSSQDYLIECKPRRCSQEQLELPRIVFLPSVKEEKQIIK